MKSTKLLLFAILLWSAQSLLTAQLIVHEPFNYPLSNTEVDPDKGVNGGHGLPATNVGGDPSGTSVGFRGNYGFMHTVVAGLTFSKNGKALLTSHNALKRTEGTGYSNSPVWMYRRMKSDPFIALRTPYANQTDSNFVGYTSTGVNVLYFSVLVNASTVNTPTQNRLVLWMNLNGSQFTCFLAQVQNTDLWKYTDQLGNEKTLGTAVANETAFIVGKFTFTSATEYKIELWFNPTPGEPLGDPTTSQNYTNTTWNGGNQIVPWTKGARFAGIETRDGANIFTYDEFRLGLSAADVMPLMNNTAVDKVNFNRLMGVQSIGNMQISLKPADNNSVQTIDIVDMKGVVVKSIAGSELRTTVTLTMGQQGMYILRATTNEGVSTQKVAVY